MKLVGATRSSLVEEVMTQHVDAPGQDGKMHRQSDAIGRDQITFFPAGFWRAHHAMKILPKRAVYFQNIRNRGPTSVYKLSIRVHEPSFHI